MNPENPTVVAGECTAQQMRLGEEANDVKSTKKPCSHQQISWRSSEAFEAQSTSPWGSLPLTPGYNLFELLQVLRLRSRLSIFSPASDFCETFAMWVQKSLMWNADRCGKITAGDECIPQLRAKHTRGSGVLIPACLCSSDTFSLRMERSRAWISRFR